MARCVHFDRGMNARLSLDLVGAFRGTAMPRSIAETHVAIDELKILNLNSDVVAAPEAAAAAEQLAKSYRAMPGASDRLRLPPPSSSTGPKIRSSIARVLASEPHPS